MGLKFRLDAVQTPDYLVQALIYAFAKIIDSLVLRPLCCPYGDDQGNHDRQRNGQELLQGRIQFSVYLTCPLAFPIMCRESFSFSWQIDSMS